MGKLLRQEQYQFEYKSGYAAGAPAGLCPSA
jgi:hypothetical protein